MATPLPFALSLNPALSFCVTDGRHLFLDRENNRYFCLARPLEAAFAAVANGNQDCDASIMQLQALGVLVRDENGVGVAACTHVIPTVSLVDGPLAPVRRHYPGLLWSTARSKWLLRRRPFSELLAQLTQVRAQCSPDDPGSQYQLDGIVHAFEALSLFATTHDQCLPRSLALALYLAERGHAPLLVFAVRLNPFKAHCWVECGGKLVGGRLEEAQHYVPILRV